MAGTCWGLGLIALAAEVDLLSKLQIASTPEVPTWLIPDFWIEFDFLDDNFESTLLNIEIDS